MKKTIVALLLLISITAFSQNPNGGQSNEDQYVKIAYIGNLTARITNKQSCTVIMHIQINGKDHFDTSIVGNGHYDFHVELNDRVQVTPNVNCSNGSGNMGQLELKFTSTTLPIKLGTVKVIPVTGKTNTFTVSFEVYNSVPGNTYQLQLSRDGSTWQTIAIQFLDDLQPNKVYSMVVEVQPTKVNVSLH